MKLTFSSFYRRTRGDYLTLECFKDSTIINTCYIDITFLENCLKYNYINSKITITVQENDDWVDKQHFYRISSLLQECPEVREFARQYYPEHVI